MEKLKCSSISQFTDFDYVSNITVKLTISMPSFVERPHFSARLNVNVSRIDICGLVKLDKLSVSNKRIILLSDLKNTDSLGEIEMRKMDTK